MFQLSTLAPKETYFIRSSIQYLSFFQSMLGRLEGGDSEEAVYPALLNGLASFIEYKKVLLRGLLTCQLQMNLPPSLINHMINEASEFEMLLVLSMQRKVNTPLEFISRLKLWLADSVGHAAGIAAFLDPAEANLAEEALKFKDSFNKLLTKASELEMMLAKTMLKDGALEYLAEETVKLTEAFICYLDKIKKLRASCKILGVGTLSPLLPDHMIREHKYYIFKIESVLGSAIVNPLKGKENEKPIAAPLSNSCKD